MKSIFKINNFIVTLICILLFCLLISCNNNIKNLNHTGSNATTETSTNVERKNIDYKYYDVLDISPAKIIIPKNQTIAQSLSVLVNDGHGNLIVFDGGRVEDADYLCDIIKDNGGVVTTWFITHIHDDHIGALYKILSDKRTDITIEEIVYDFANFEWYYEKMGNDAGIYHLFENAINVYNKHIYINKMEKRFEYTYEDQEFIDRYKDSIEVPSYLRGPVGGAVGLEVNKLNDLYKLDQDPINNTSIVYLVSLSNGNHNMLIFGDLGYEGGNKFFKFLDETDNEYLKYLTNRIYSSDIIVLSHHGQNGIDPELYKRFSPKVVVWPTSKDIYENSHGRYYTDDTKKALSEISRIKYEIKTYEETAVIR